MSLQHLLRGLQKLSITSSPWQLTQATCANRLIHTSPVCHHVLNRRLYPPNRYPSKKTGRWVERKPMRELYPDYTTNPLPHPKMGGMGPNGHIWNWRRSGGNKRLWRMLDLHRSGIDQQKPMKEVVKKILYDPNRSGRLALVAGGERKRYILATANMKIGDVITSSRELFDSPMRAAEGDSYPIGSLAIGSIVNSVELFPGDGTSAVMAAGCQATIIRKTSEHVILRLPSKREVAIMPTCLATVGRVGNIAHNQRVIGKAGRNRWLGFRPRSGYYQKKTGRFGRKIKPPKKLNVYKKAKTKGDPLRRMPLKLVPESRKREGRIFY